MPQDPNTQHLKDLAENSDHALVQGAKYLQAVKDLEMPIEGQLMKLDEIAKNTKPKDVQEIKINGISVITLKGDPGNVFDELTPEQIEKIRGPEGKPAKDPTKDELLQLIEPLIPEAIPGLDGNPGHTPTDEELTALIKPLIPEPIPGKSGETPTDEKLVALIKPLIPPAKKGKDGSSDTPEQIKKKLESLEVGLDYEKLHNRPNLETFRGRHQSSRDYDLSELKDVSIPNPTNGYVLTYSTTLRKWIASPGGISSGITGLISQGTNITITGTGTLADPYVINSTASGGGGGITAWSTPPETPNSDPDAGPVITAFTVTGTPTDVTNDGLLVFLGAGYSLVAGQVVFDNPPNFSVRYRVASTWSTPPETPDSSITTFTVGATIPTDVEADGALKFNVIDYTFSAGTIIFINPPSFSVHFR